MLWWCKSSTLDAREGPVYVGELDDDSCGGGGGAPTKEYMPNVEKGAAVRRADGISEQHHDPSGRRIFSLTNPDERSAAFDRVWVLASDHSGNLPSSEFSRRRRSPFEGIERIR
jgi:hypothetical protein